MMTDKPVLFEARNIHKNYGVTSVLRNIDITIYKGEIIGLIGENGAGKSTLLKIIAGVERPSAGSMLMNGNPYCVKNLIEANKHGVGMVFQEQSLVLNITVAQNIFLGREQPYSFAKLINWRKVNSAAKKALERLGIAESIAPNKKVYDLNFVSRQMVEIAKVLDVILCYSEHGALLLLDEPTTVLSEPEIEVLFREMRSIKEKGISVIFISHRLDEVLAITDRIYIFKDGDKTGEIETKNANTNLLYEKMVGRSSSGAYYQLETQTAASGEVVLEAEKLGKYGSFKDVSFKLYRGEVLGFCGVEGSGKEELCAVICGDDEWTTGTLKVKEKTVRPFSSPAAAFEQKILSIPKDRRLEGMAGILSITVNIIMSSLRILSQFGFISSNKTAGLARYWINKMGIKCAGIDERIDRLSGGNAQKVIFSRVSTSSSDILILNHPTRGIDIGAKEDIYKAIRELTGSGKSVILLGDTLDECIGLASRILVMKDGVLQKEFNAPAGAKPEQIDIVKYMM
ncbi:MAG: sugar ABC transporter ATP-binding protein [Spirochaetaceae bacterium]|jgi:ribose transport system ATP-binding protein|nr:sugar ABC transporter ATP-binding protein [Spirochaetaceae bacterium]